jgi:uncharacterized protein YbjT (DUF2867 family)
MKIAITGPSGNVGSKVVKSLLAQGGHELILLAHKPEKLAAEKARGAKLIQGDVEDAAYITAATQGVDAFFVMIPPKITSHAFRAYQNVVAQNAANAVRDNKIRRVVFLSSMGAHLDHGQGPVDGLHDGEEILKITAKALTIVRAAYFMENFMMYLGPIAKSHTLPSPWPPATTVPMIAAKDIAATVVKALTDTRTRGVNVIQVQGPREYSFADAARFIGQTIGQPVTLVKVSSDAVREMLTNLGATYDVARQFAEMYEAREKGRLKFELLREPATVMPTTFEEFARAVLAPALGAPVASR